MLFKGLVTEGCETDKFCPSGSLKRSEVAVLLWKLAGSPQPSHLGSDLFDDVKASSSANKAIGWMADAHITEGCQRQKFCPDTKTTRATMASFLYRFNGSPYIGSATSSFEDVSASELTHLQYSAIVWLEKKGITTGCSSDPKKLFCTKDSLGRGQLAAFFYRNHLRTQ